MPVIPKEEAVERLARVVEASKDDDLADYYAELFPSQPKISPTEANGKRAEAVEYVRTKMQPDEMVDLWTVVFSRHRDVYYDDADALLCHDQDEPWFADK